MIWFSMMTEFWRGWFSPRTTAEIFFYQQYKEAVKNSPKKVKGKS